MKTKYKIGQVITFDLMGHPRRKGKITGFKRYKQLGLLVLTKKYAIPICRVDKYKVNKEIAELKGEKT